MDYLIGIDLGTSATKTILADENGQILSSSSCAYPLKEVNNGWAEQNPEDWKRAVLFTVKDVIKKLGLTDIRFGELVYQGRCTGW